MRCMDVGDIGEFELIDRLAATIAAEGKASIAAIEGQPPKPESGFWSKMKEALGA